MGELDRVDFRGEPVTRRQRAAILAVEADIKREFEVFQGSWQGSSTAASSTTHNGAGVMDIWLSGMGDNDFTHSVTRKLRDVGCQAAWFRGPAPFGGFSFHWHVCDLDTRGMDPLAVQQVVNYKVRGNGLWDPDLRTGDDPEPWRPADYHQFNFDRWRKAQELSGDISKLSDRIEGKAETLEELRNQRDQLRKQRARLLNH